jgi:uracil phosphoribosyltransferase
MHVTRARTQEHTLVAVSIMRAGDSMLEALQQCLPSVAVGTNRVITNRYIYANRYLLGKILIQRDEETAAPRLYYR